MIQYFVNEWGAILMEWVGELIFDKEKGTLLKVKTNSLIV